MYKILYYHFKVFGAEKKIIVKIFQKYYQLSSNYLIKIACIKVYGDNHILQNKKK